MRTPFHGCRCERLWQIAHHACQGSSWRAWAICIALIATIAAWTIAIAWNERNAAIAEKERDATNLSLVLTEQTSRHIAVVDLVLQGLQAKLRDRQVESQAAFQALYTKPEIRADLTLSYCWTQMGGWSAIHDRVIYLSLMRDIEIISSIFAGVATQVFILAPHRSAGW
jgi:hypothetical protein